jgi:hypothetical protein
MEKETLIKWEWTRQAASADCAKAHVLAVEGTQQGKVIDAAELGQESRQVNDK